LNPPAAPVCLIVADDLTGACDAAAPFAVRGYGVVVSLASADAQGADVLALSTETRGLCPQDLRAAYTALAAGLEGRRVRPADLLFKKIDSTLRGAVGAEIALAAETLGCDAAIVTPAFPAMGRTVESGALRVSGAAFDPLDLASYWLAQGLSGCDHMAPSGVPAALAAGRRFLSVDAATDRDLDAIAAAGLASDRRVLWAGSAGLASALARALPRGPREPPPRTRHSAVLFCIGSDHSVTLEQRRGLLAARPVVECDAETASPESIAEVFRTGRHVFLKVPYGRVSADRLRLLTGDWRGPLVLSGGATASLVCRALGVREILLHREIVPGIPRGVISAGLFDGAPIVTKSGGFGPRGALVQILDDLTCL